MAKKWSTSADQLTWRFTLRDGLTFHDGSPVTTLDVIASLRRWMTIDAMAKKVAAVTTAITAVDGKTFDAPNSSWLRLAIRASLSECLQGQQFILAPKIGNVVAVKVADNDMGDING